MTLLIVETPITYTDERTYINRVIFAERLGLKYEHRCGDRGDVRLSLDGNPGEIIMPDVLFQTPGRAWLTAASMPTAPCSRWDVEQADIPGMPDFGIVPLIFGDETASATVTPRGLYLPIDVSGSAFFMLTRYEEQVLHQRDEHDRFPAHLSIAAKDGFLDRPIIDEYVEILWAAMHQLWPTLERRQQIYTVTPTHDVDHPFGVKGQSVGRLARSIAGDILRYRKYDVALQRLAAAGTPGSAGDKLDPNNSFAWLMEEEEQRGLKGAYFFMTGKTSPYDPGYSITAPRVQNLMRQIHERGHEIGLHPSYGSLGNKDTLETEVAMLRDGLLRAGISQSSIGGRQHYLRWRTDETWRQWDEAGLSYDSTLAFAQSIGFRAGTCHPYSVWSLSQRQHLSLVEKPLLVMDTTLFDRRYMGLTSEDAVAAVRRLAERSKVVKGCFVLLWHNDFHLRHGSKDLYRQVLEAIV